MKYLFYLLFAIIIISCSNDSLVEKNIEDFLHQEFPEYDIISAEYSRLFILHPLNDDKIPAPDTSDFSATFSHSMTTTGAGTAISLISNGCNRSAINQVVECDELFRRWETGAVDYVKIGFMKLGHKKDGIEDIGICFKIDSLYNVVQMYLVSDDEYVYNKVFDNN